jgi:hypothetical protein
LSGAVESDAEYFGLSLTVVTLDSAGLPAVGLSFTGALSEPGVDKSSEGAFGADSAAGGVRFFSSRGACAGDELFGGGTTACLVGRWMHPEMHRKTSNIDAHIFILLEESQL